MSEAIDNRYQIITNVNKRKILVINEMLDVDREPNIEFEDFEAIFINVINTLTDYNLLTIRLASPLLSEKCRFKPCFVTQRLIGWLGPAEIIVDGYANSPTDRLMSQSIEDIYSSLRRLNFLLGTEPVVTHAEEMFRLVRYAISRGHYTFSSEPVLGLSSGYMALYNYTLLYPGQELIAAEKENSSTTRCYVSDTYARVDSSKRFMSAPTAAPITSSSSRVAPSARVPTYVSNRLSTISAAPTYRRNQPICTTVSYVAPSAINF